MTQKQSLILHLAAIVSTGFLFLFPSLVTAADVDLARTGQTTCYSQAGAAIGCAGTGQDGEYQKGIAWPNPRFTDNDDGSITDNLSGLTWLKDTQCIGRVKWQNALDAVNTLADGSCGLTDDSVAGDWRMPNYLELISIANLSLASPLSWYGSFGFTNLLAYGYWSSTSYNISTSMALNHQFSAQLSGAYPKGGTYQTWPVKGESTGPAKIWKTGQTTCYDQAGQEIDCSGTGQDGDYQAGESPPVTRFTDNSDGTVTDNMTGLVWLQDMGCFGWSVWEDALADANSLADGACGLTDGSTAGDWRLPNALESISVTDFSQAAPMLPAGHPFSNFTNLHPWTSSNYMSLPSYGFYRSVSTGSPGFIQKSYEDLFVSWPVRDGNDTDTCRVNDVSGVIEDSDHSYEACDSLIIGSFLAENGASVFLSGGLDILFLPDFLIEQGATLNANVCGQSLCETSPTPMPYGCHSCISQICDIDSYCCDTGFDEECLEQVSSECGLVCE